MASANMPADARPEGWTDEHVVKRVLAGESSLYEIIMRRYNQRLYRVARAIVRDDTEAEDVMQEAYVRAYQHLRQFAGRSPFSAWLTRIAVHEALARVRQRDKIDQLDRPETDDGEFVVEPKASVPDPEAATSREEMRRILEEMLLRLPQQYRIVLMLRDIEEMTTFETARALEISEENVKVRLHRGRTILRRELAHRVGASAKHAFPFMGERCDRVVRNVLQSLASAESASIA